MADEYEAPQSREEALLQNIIGADNVLEPPQSRNEEILTAILDDTEYNKPPESRIEGLLIDLKVKINNMIPEPTANIDIISNASNIDVKSYATANVAVPQGVFPSGVYSIAANGDYDVAGYASAHVEVPQPSGVYSIATNGDYDIASYASAHVAVPMPSGTISITSNASNIDVASYAAANVNVPQGITPSGTYDITSNGVYDVTSYQSASVNVSGGGGGALAGEITKWIEGSGFSLYDSSASFIARSAFYYAYYLESVEFTEVETINSSAFYRSPNLKTVSLPNVSSIGSYAFYSCISLETIYMPNVESIGQSAFTYCSKLQDFEASKVWFLGTSAFMGCQSLTSINFPLLRSGNAQMFENCIRLKTATIGSSQTALYSGAFSSCYELETISIPGVSSLAQNVFRACSKLSYIDFPKVSNISTCAFMDCINLETVHLGSMVSIYSVNISSSAFFGCVSLKALYIENTSTYAGTLSANAFNNTPLSDSTYLGYFGSIYVPASKVSTYKAATNWSLFADRITAIPEVTVT